MDGTSLQAHSASRPLADDQSFRGVPDARSPVKTREGRDEIRRRSPSLDQRQRAVLLMVDGRRTLSQIRRVAARIGAADSCFDELLDMGLVALPAPAAAQGAAAAEPADARLNDFAPTMFIPVSPETLMDDAMPNSIQAEARNLPSELFDEFVRSNQIVDQRVSATPVSRRRGGKIDAVVSTLFPLLESAFGALGGLTAAERSQDEALEEGRRILVREIRAKAPVTGALTMIKLRRAASREDLLALFDEVGAHLSIPMRRLSTQQTLLHVRRLLQRPM